MKPPILITGSHRSGKSYTVKGINLYNNFNIIHEPLNVNTTMGWTGLDIEHYYTYIDESNSDKFRKAYSRTFNNYNYRLLKQLRKTSIGDLSGVVKDFANSLRYRLNRKRALIDDPFAIFSAEWFYREFNSDIIIMIRHPASFAASLKLLKYNFPFSHLLNQKNLVEKKLGRFEPKLIEYADRNPDIVKQSVLLWRMIYDTVKQYRDEYGNNWFFMRFEDIARKPEIYFEKIYYYLHLPVHPASLRNIRHNIRTIKSTPDKELGILTNLHGGEYSVEDHLMSYKKILTEDEINYVKEKAHDVWQHFYSEDDWE